MKTVQLIRLADVKKFAKTVAQRLKGGEILALIGPLGAGKTTFVKALAKQLKVRPAVTSPTFTFLHRYTARLGKKKVSLYHLDLYRAKNFREAKLLGLEEFWGDPKTITAIEWADKIKKHLPKKTKIIKFTNS
jgi:tRNA threonylcarbamoyladenosine biosynthesis protein TsaE